MNSNKFSALFSDDDESSEECQVNSLHSSDNQPSSQRQSGGLIVSRIQPDRNIEINAKTGEISTELGFTSEELKTCCKVIDKLGENPELFRLSMLKSLRQSLHPLINEHMKKYATSSVSVDKRHKKRRRKEMHAEADQAVLLEELERKYINRTQLRAIRIHQLEKLNEEQGFDSAAVPRIPDGIGLLTNVHPASSMGLIAEHSINETSNDTFIHTLRTPQSCYICHKPFVKLHFFYAQLCPECAEFNYMKRNETADLAGRICLVTGNCLSKEQYF